MVPIVRSQQGRNVVSYGQPCEWKDGIASQVLNGGLLVSIVMFCVHKCDTVHMHLDTASAMSCGEGWNGVPAAFIQATDAATTPASLRIHRHHHAATHHSLFTPDFALHTHGNVRCAWFHVLSHPVCMHTLDVPRSPRR